MPSPLPFTLCFCCDALVRQLRMPLVPVLVVAEFRAGDALHRRLRGYKDAPVAEGRQACAARLAGMLERWLATDPRGARLAAAPYPVVTVPSSGRPAGDPLATVVRAVPALAGRHRSLLVRGPDPTGHLRAARRGFALRPGTEGDSVRGATVLVLDDSLVTGARAQSAAAVLRLGGAEVVGVLALGRLVRASPEGLSAPG